MDVLFVSLVDKKDAPSKPLCRNDFRVFRKPFVKTAIKFSCLNYSMIPCLCKEKLKADRSVSDISETLLSAFTLLI